MLRLLQLHMTDRAAFDRRIGGLMAGISPEEETKYREMARGMKKTLSALETEVLTREGAVSEGHFTELLCVLHTNLHAIADLEGRRIK